MEYLLEILASLLQNEEYAGLVFVGLSAAAALGFGFSLTFLIGSLSTPFRRRVQFLVGERAHPTNDQDSAGILPPLESITKYVIPKKDWERSHILTKLVHAGYRSNNAMKNFYAMKILLAITFPVLFLIGTRQFPQITTTQIFLLAMTISFFGLILPNMVLDRLAIRRIRLLRNGFPDALDLLVVCIESGLGLNAALQRVSNELSVSHMELSEELNLVNVEIRAGVNRIDALKNMAHRTGLEEIRGLVALLDQSVRFGTSIADTIRVYAEEFRDKRMQQAEETAAKIGTKMIFPLTFCLWPGFFLVAIGPAILKIVKAFSG
jgi:tight adherence protein C